MLKRLNAKGFTLVELLAVIVILGVVYAIAVPNYNKYMNNSRKDAFVSSAIGYSNAVKDMMISDDTLPVFGATTVYNIDEVKLTKGGQSGFDNSKYTGYVICNYSGSNTSDADYIYYVFLRDTAGNHLFAETSELTGKKSVTRGYVKPGSETGTIMSGAPVANTTYALTGTTTSFKTNTSLTSY